MAKETALVELTNRSCGLGWMNLDPDGPALIPFPVRAALFWPFRPQASNQSEL